MKTRVWICLIFNFLFLTPVTRAGNLRIENAFVAKTVLIHGKVVEVQESTNGVVFTIEVAHVFYGDRAYVGTRFDAWTRTVLRPISAGSDTLFDFDPLPKRGETVIWWTKTSKNDQLLRPLRQLLASQLPARSVHPARYQAALEWAQAVERVSSAPRERQLDLLTEAAGSKSYEISYWAIVVLAQEWGQKATNVLEVLAKDKNLAAVSVTALDEGLDRLQGDEWRDSTGRWTFLERSLRSVETDFEAKIVLDYWSKVVRERQRQRFTQAQCLEIVKSAVRDPHCPDRIRNQLFADVLRPFLGTSDDDQSIWDFAIENISQPINSAVAGNAAFMLLDTPYRTPRRFRTLLKLYRDEKHPRVAEQLGNVLTKWHDDAAMDKTMP
ncbi:MAG: hypothetical protein ACKV2Q_04015 [Planctomycetaceae bacterium]